MSVKIEGQLVVKFNIYSQQIGYSEWNTLLEDFALCNEIYGNKMSHSFMFSVYS